MSTTAAQQKGILVVHADGAASWWSRLVPAVSAVTVPVGPGAAVQVDAGHPERVLAWSVEATGDLAALARALGDPDLVDRTRALTSDAGEVYVDDVPLLTEPWTRRATVAAVDRCTVRPIAEGALLLDWAESAYNTGNLGDAERLFAAAAPTLMTLGEQCVDGLLAGGVAADVTRVAAVAAEALVAHGWGPDIRALSQRLSEGLNMPVDNGNASVLLSDWVTAAAVETHLGGGVPSAVRPAYVDPEVVPQRLLAWTGADHPDLIVEMDSGESTLVSVLLEASADVRSPEAAHMMAYAAESDGTLVAVAPMHVERRSLTAVLTPPARDEITLVFGIYDADIDPMRLRNDATGQVLIEVDRWMRDAFTRHRYAQVLSYASSAENLDEARARQRTHLGIARTAADNAIELLESEGLRPGVDQAAAALLMGRRDAIKSYRGTIAAAATTVSSWRPLLAEIVEPEPADDGDD